MGFYGAEDFLVCRINKFVLFKGISLSIIREYLSLISKIHLPSNFAMFRYLTINFLIIKCERLMGLIFQFYSYKTLEILNNSDDHYIRDYL